MIAPTKRLLSEMRVPSNDAMNANTAINPTNTQFTVDKSIGIVCSWLCMYAGRGNRFELQSAP